MITVAMSWDDFAPEPQEPDHEPIEPNEPERPGPGDDPAVQELEPLLQAHLDERPDTVFYETQPAVLFEQRFFHWVTARALRDLREAGKIGSALEELSPNVPLRFYFSRRCRYWKRKEDELRRVVLAFLPAPSACNGSFLSTPVCPLLALCHSDEEEEPPGKRNKPWHTRVAESF